MSGHPLDCLKCPSLCCRQAGYVEVSQADIRRLAKFLGLTVRAFEQRHVVETTRKGAKRIESGYDTCQFLAKTGCARSIEAPPSTAGDMSAGTSRTEPSRIRAIFPNRAIGPAGATRRKTAVSRRERRSLRGFTRADPGQILFRRKLRPIALGIHHAEKAERLVPGGLELVPAPRRNCDQVELLHGPRITSPSRQWP